MSKKKASKTPRPPGRPLFGTEPMTKVIVIRLTPTQHELIQKEAKRLKTSDIGVIRAALDKYFKGA